MVQGDQMKTSEEIFQNVRGRLRFQLQFQYMQISNFIRILIQKTGLVRSLTEFENVMIKPIKLKGLLTKCYQILMAHKK